MKRILGVGLLAIIVFGAAWLVQSSAEERAVRQVVNEVQAAALSGLNQRQPEALDPYFATAAEGAVPGGLAETQQTYKDFVTKLPGNNMVQFHSLDVLAIEVHQEAGLAKVTYRLHFSVVQDGQVLFGGQATQDLALLRTPRGWRISGGDAPQLDNVVGSWPRP